MDFKTGILCSVLLFLTWSHGVTAQQDRPGELPFKPTFFIAAPIKVHPNQVYQMWVSIMRLQHDHINVRASIKRGGLEYAAIQERFNTPASKLLQMRMNRNARPGNYTLRIEGTMNGGSGGLLFWNESRLMFDTKQISVITQTNKPIYKQGQSVKIRVMPMTPELKSIHGTMDVYIYDAAGMVVRRWLSMQSNAGGVLELEQQLSMQPKYGKWRVAVEAFGHWYNRSFTVEEHWKPRFDVNVTMPHHITEDSFGIAGVVVANHTSGRPARGNGYLRLEIRDPTLKHDPANPVVSPVIIRTIKMFNMRTDFMFTMDELKRAAGGNIADREIHVNISIFDWNLLINRTGSASAYVYSRKITLKFLGDPIRTFKPGMPFKVYMVAFQQDGTALTTPRRLVTLTRTVRSEGGGERAFPEEKIVIADDGVAEYRVFPEDRDELIKIRAYYDTNINDFKEITAYRYYAPQRAYVYISTTTTKPMVNGYMVFTVKTSVQVDNVYYVIVGNGNIIVGGIIEMTSMQKTFSIALSQQMSPSARIIAYTIRDNEIMADGINFFVNGSRVNDVNVTVNKGKDFSRDTVEIVGKTEPGSFILFSGIDYELYRFTGGTFLTESQLIEELHTFDVYGNTSFHHSWRLPEEQEEHIFFPAPDYGYDGNTTFAFAGLVTFSDANVTMVPHPCNVTRNELPCMNGQCYPIEKQCDGFKDCIVDGRDEMGCDYHYIDSRPIRRSVDYLQRITRHYEQSGDWLWKSYFVKPDGKVALKLDVPKEPMSWAIGAMAVHRDKGLGIMPIPARHQASRPFYIRMEIPEHDLRRGEQVGVRIALFNYWTEHVEVLVTLHASDDYRFVIVEEFGIASSYNPRTTGGDVQSMIYVESGKSQEVHFPVLPIKKGKVDITMSATSFMGQETITKSINVKFDGVTNYYHTPYLVDLVSQGSVIVPDLEIPVPERFIQPDKREHLYVPGSERAFVHVVGDVVGPNFFEPFLNTWSLMRMSDGAGAEAVFDFAYNLNTLLFLRQTSSLGPDMLKSSLDHMTVSLQRMMSYYNSTHKSFSMFRDHHEPSVWLTAFAAKSLHKASVGEWEYNLYIPIDIINDMMIFITGQQSKTTGSFIDPAPLYDRKMRSNATLVNGEYIYPSNTSLTAFVLIAMGECTKVSGAAKSAMDNARSAALKYLEPRVAEMTDPFQTALVTYALHVADSARKSDAFRKLDRMKIETEFIYWANKIIPPNPTKIINTVPFHLPRIEYLNEGTGVSATSYALMVYILNMRTTESVPIMRWLQTMRNHKGAWASAQDSIVALEALTLYASRNPNRDIYNMRIVIQSTATPNWQQVVNLNKENWAQLHTVEIPRVFGSVKAHASGNGLALLQLHTWVNVEYMYQQRQPIEKAFDLYIDKLYFHGKNMSIMEMTACAKWTRPDIGNSSGMVVLEVETPTGYIVMNDALRLYAASGVVPNLKRAEWHNKKVSFFFESLDYENTTCVYFRGDRWFPISNSTIQHRIRVWDYYEPGLHNTSMYSTYALFNLPVCYVCGSFQCPYCPDYNAAAGLQISVVLSALCVALGYMMSRALLRNNR